MFLQAVGDAGRPQLAAAGRCRPTGATQPPTSSPVLPTGTQFLQAVGCAEAGLYAAGRPGLAEVAFAGDEVVFVTAGDGTTSEGEFWEAMNTACNLKLPVVFLVEDNGYAISVPVEVQHRRRQHLQAGGVLPRPAAARGGRQRSPGERRGCCARRSPTAARARARRSCTPTSSAPTRTRSPTTSRMYRTAGGARGGGQARPPAHLPAPARSLEGIADEAELKAIETEVEDEVRTAADEALEARRAPRPSRALLYVYSPDVDPTATALLETAPRLEGEPRTMVDLLNRCLRDEMARDPRIVHVRRGRGRRQPRGGARAASRARAASSR